MASLIEKLLRTGDKKTLRQLRNYADSINALEDSLKTFSDAELREETDRLRERHRDGEKLDDLLPEAFAAVREASSRTLGMRHFDVQLMGGAALHLGNIAEMKTQFNSMLSAWVRGDVDAIARTFNEDMAASPELRAALIGRRNANWANWIERRMQSPGSVLVAVGAGHLAGHDSVQRYLESKGYRVRRIQ